MSVESRRVGNLPAPVTSFVNRRAELAAVRRLLAGAQLVTLTGVAGVGKTRLSLAVGAEARRAFPDGVWLVELAHVRDEALLAYTVAHALGIHNLAGDPLGSLIDFLRPRCAMLILDNCEHVVDGCAELVELMLSAAADVRVVATSREPLGLAGEHEVRVAPLSVPPVGGDRPSAAGQHAVDLFNQRARAAAPGFLLDDDNRADVEDVCRRLDGIPLAIELAVVRLRVLSVQQLRTRLDHRFDLLTGGSRTALPHQRTLRAAVDWSYELCDPAERTLWERASVFGGDFDLSAVEEIYAELDGEGAADAVVTVVDGLVAKSVLISEERDGRVWYGLLETLREYGRQRLQDGGEQARVRRAYGLRYLRLAERADREWFGPDQIDWNRLLHREQANIRVALQDFIDAQATEEALRLCAALWFHWQFSGWLGESRLWFERVLAKPARRTRALAEALYVATFMASTDGNLDAAGRLAAEGLALAEELGDQVIAAQILTRQAAILLYRREATAGRPLVTDALARFEAAGAGGGPHAVLARNVLAGIRLLEGDAADAIQLARQSIALCRASGDTTLLTASLLHLGRAEWLSGDLADAVGHVRASIGLQRGAIIPSLFGQGVELAAWTAAGTGGHADLRRAAVLLGAAERVWPDLGLFNVRGVPFFRRFHDQCEAQVRAGLGDAEFGTAFARGAGMDIGDVITYITGVEAATPSAAGAGEAEPAIRLTAREREVAVLIADGLSNRQIAGKLVVSPRTAESHVQNILAKLGFTSRAQVASYVASARRASDRGDGS